MVVHLRVGLVALAFLGSLIGQWAISKGATIFMCYEILQTERATVELPYSNRYLQGTLSRGCLFN